MRKTMLMMALPLVLVAGCKMEVNTDDTGNAASVKVGEDGNVAITANEGANGVSLSVPGFEGKMKIPGMELGGENMDIAGMKPYPGSKLNSINVTDNKGPDNGVVDMRFTSPGTPDQVAAYYAGAAREGDFSGVNVVNKDGKAIVTANKPGGDDLTITIDPAPGGSASRILIKDGEK